MRVYIYFTLLTIIINGEFIHGQHLHEGDHCQSFDNKTGICKAIKDCAPAKQLIAKNELITCSSVEKTPIVCCPELKEKVPVHIEKCQEYGRKLYKVVLEPVPTIIPQYTNISLCGHTAIPLIVGGEKAQGKEFPHMALLGFGEKDNIKWSCGGSLISENFVLTAAHCFYNDLDEEVTYVRLGDLNKKTTTDDAVPQEFTIIDHIPHPDYDPDLKYYDIMLLKLDRDVEITGYVRPACLYTESMSPDIFIATGWGSTDFGSDSSDDLLKVTLVHYPEEVCNVTFSTKAIMKVLPRGITTDTQLCAGGKMDEEKDTCQGDSGGPLQIYHPSVTCMYSIVGITSGGLSCGTKNRPSIFTRVYPFISWIEEEVWGK